MCLSGFLLGIFRAVGKRLFLWTCMFSDLLAYRPVFPLPSFYPRLGPLSVPPLVRDFEGGDLLPSQPPVPDNYPVVLVPHLCSVFSTPRESGRSFLVFLSFLTLRADLWSLPVLKSSVWASIRIDVSFSLIKTRHFLLQAFFPLPLLFPLTL